MLMRMLNSLIEHTPVLAARRTVKTKWYIINRYNESHDDTIDESAVMLFLCDEQRGGLTEEQRAFTKEKKEEVYSSFSVSVFELILYHVMHSLHLVSGPEDFATVFSNPKGNETGRRLPPCNSLRGAVCPSSGQGRVPAPSRDLERILPNFGPGFRTGGTGGRGAGESPGAFVRPGSHFRPQCGRFRGFGVGAVPAGRF